MTIYSIAVTTPPNSAKETIIVVEGDVIDLVRVRFPPGPSGLLKVAIYYGNEQIWPDKVGSWFVGDNEVIQWSEFYPLPEALTRFTVKTVNDDDTYEHSVYLTISTKYFRETFENRIAESITRLLRPLAGMLRALAGGR